MATIVPMTNKLYLHLQNGQVRQEIGRIIILLVFIGSFAAIITLMLIAHGEDRRIKSFGKLVRSGEQFQRH